MAGVELHREGDLAYREATPYGSESGPPVLLVHGFPESSRMWEPLMTALAHAGRRSVAPDLYGLGDSFDDGSATFERNLESLAGFHRSLRLGRVALVVHDWGAFVGLAWAAERPDQVAALVISDAGFFSDGRWHGMAAAIRGEHGEKLLAALDRDGFAGLLRASGDAAFTEEDIDAYWRPFEEGRGRRATLEFYRSMDFEKLQPYERRLAELRVPTLLLWGEHDPFATLAAAKRFQRRIPDARLVVLDAGHFVFDEQRERAANEAARFLTAA